MEEFITIQKAADILSVSSDTIRRWEKKGLIKAERNAQNYRVFSFAQLLNIKQKMGTDMSSQRGFYVLKNESMSAYTTIELFAGAGGMALGLENAGLHTNMLVEFDSNPARTLIKNRPNWNVVIDDVSNVDFSNVSADVVVGGFPCQAFSYAGRKLGFEDARGTLFFEFARCIKEVQPKIIIGENVRGLERHDEGRTLAAMLDILSEIGYKVEYKILKAHYFDVAQKRERLIMIGVRNDLDIPIIFPKENDYALSVRDALQDVPDSEGQQYSKYKYDILNMIPEGGYWKDLPKDIQKEYMGGSYYLGGGKTGMARRLAWDEPSLTLTCSPAQKQTERCHPSETRPLTVREYARIQSFPDTWEFEGSLTYKYKQIGNAVPVNLAFHIGRAIINMLDGNTGEVQENIVSCKNNQPTLF